jgi:hypothetical protein
MGGQPLVGGKPSATREIFIGEKPTWFQHQQA